MGVCWSSQHADDLPTGQLVKLRWVGEQPRVLTQCLGPRDWTDHLGSWPLTSWSTLCRHSLCLRELPRSLWMGGFGGQNGTCSFQRRMDGIAVSEHPTCTKLT